MQYQICECGERIPPNELPTKLLIHWNHQQSCLYSHIGCVSKTNFDSHCVEHARIRVLTGRYFPTYGQNLRSVLILENMGQRQPLFLHIVRSVSCI